MAAWCAAFVLSVAAWLVVGPLHWETALVAAALVATAVGAIRTAMVRHGRRPALVAVAKRIVILLVVAPGLFLALALVLGNDDAELATDIWWLDYGHLGLSMVYFDGPGYVTSLIANLDFDSPRAELLGAILISAAEYLVAAAILLGLATAVARRFTSLQRPPTLTT